MSRQDVHRYLNTDHLESNLRTRALHGGAITVATQAINFFLTLGSTAILARLLTPSDYGLVAMVGVIIGFTAMFKDFGLSMATVQRDEITPGQITALFWLNGALGLALTLLTAASAPALAWFYAEPRLISLTLFLASLSLISGLGVQHQALLRRQMRYGALAAIEITALTSSVALAIVAALHGARYWALALMMVTAALIRTLGFWLFCRWSPSLPDRRVEIGALLAFGGNLAGSNVVDYVTRSFDQLMIGRVWGGGELGAYERANRLLQLPLKMLNTPISHVAIPVLCRLQHAPERYRRFYVRSLYPLAFVVMPGMAFITVMSGDVIHVLMGEQWGEAGAILGVFGILGLLYPVSNTNGWHFIASGATSRLLRWTLIDGSLVVATVLVALPYGALGVAVGLTAVRVVLFLPGIWYATRTVPVRVSDVLGTIRLPMMSSLAMGAMLYVGRETALVEVQVWPRLLIAFPLAAVIYLTVACVGSRSMSPLLDLPRLFVAVLTTRKPSNDAREADLR